MRYVVPREPVEMDTRCLSRLIALAGLLTAGVTSGASADDTDFRYVRPYGGRVMSSQPRDSFAFIGGQVYHKGFHLAFPQAI